MTNNEYIPLFNAVVGFAPYSSWRRVAGRNEVRDRDNSLVLTPVGLTDWRSDERTSLIQVARDLGIEVANYLPNMSGNGSTTQSQGDSSPESITRVDFSGITEESEQKAVEVKEYFERALQYKDSEDAQKVVTAYLKSRKIEVSPCVNEALTLMDARVVKKGDKAEAPYEIVVPIYAIKGGKKEVVKVSRIGVSAKGDKVYKRQWGNYAGDNASFFGRITDTQRYIVEGFEDCLTIIGKVGVEDCSVSGVITHCAGNLKKVSSILDTIRQSVPEQEMIAILDNDESNTSLLASEGLPKYVKRLMPKSVGVDANDALKMGRLDLWWTGLEVVTDRQIQYLNTIKAQKSEEIYLMHKEVITSGFFKIRKDQVTGETYCRRTPRDDWERIEEKKNLNQVRSVGRVVKAERDEEIGRIRAENRVAIASGGRTQDVPPTYNIPSLEEHLSFFTNHELKAKLLIDVPEWDGRDRLRELTDMLDSSYFTDDEVYAIFREWCAKSWLRIYDPSANQQFLALTGAQGAGKSEIVYALMKGYGRYSAQPDIPTGQGASTKINRSFSDLIVGFIDEFDKLPYDTQIILKDFITQQSMKFDVKWGVEDKRVVPKYSLIGCSNEPEPLRDTTGNRRYRVIPLNDIRLKKDGSRIDSNAHNYPADLNDPDRDWNSLQLVAQYRALAESGDYQVNKALFDKITAQLEDLTPEDSRDTVANIWLEEAEAIIKEKQGELVDSEKWDWIEANGIISTRDAEDILKCCESSAGQRRRFINHALERSGLRDRSFLVRGYADSDHRSQTRFLVWNPVRALEVHNVLTGNREDLWREKFPHCFEGQNDDSENDLDQYL